MHCSLCSQGWRYTISIYENTYFPMPYMSCFNSADFKDQVQQLVVNLPQDQLLQKQSQEIKNPNIYLEGMPPDPLAGRLCAFNRIMDPPPLFQNSRSTTNVMPTLAPIVVSKIVIPVSSFYYSGPQRGVYLAVSISNILVFSIIQLVEPLLKDTLEIRTLG